MKNIVVFASGSGSNFQSIIDAVESGKINARITGLISNKDGIKALERAGRHNIPTRILNESVFEDYQDYEKELLLQLVDWDTDLIALAGYLRKIPVSVINRYEHRILNIHPSLLPKFGGKGFYGIKVHQAVIASKEAESGCTIHVVTKEFDEGPVLEQSKVPVKSDDTPQTLAARVLEQEHILYPKVIANYLTTLD